MARRPDASPTRADVAGQMDSAGADVTNRGNTGTHDADMFGEWKVVCSLRRQQ